MEWIDLTKPPYTNAVRRSKVASKCDAHSTYFSVHYGLQTGESGIPLRLVERYAEEVDKDFMTIAMILESLRERCLARAGLQFVCQNFLLMVPSHLLN